MTASVYAGQLPLEWRKQRKVPTEPVDLFAYSQIEYLRIRVTGLLMECEQRANIFFNL